MNNSSNTASQLSSRPMGSITFEGNIGGTPTFAQKPGEEGWSRLSFSVAYTERRRDAATGEWADVDLPTWYRCTLWGKRAESLQGLLTSGLGVRIEGRLAEAHWRDSQGELQFSYDVTIDNLSLVPYRIASVELKSYAPPVAPAPPQPPVDERHPDDV